METPRLILLCGLPGAGKTTLAVRLARERNAVRLTKDDWLWAVGLSPWDDEANERMERQLWRLAQRLLGRGSSVILDFGLWARVERDQIRTAARRLGVGVELHHLDVPVEEQWRRVEARNSVPPWDVAPIGREHLLEWSRLFEPPDDDELALFDPPGAGRPARRAQHLPAQLR